MVHSLRDLTSDEINALYATSGNLLLELPQHSEFGIDGSLWTVQSLSGVKFIPPGLHLFVVSSPAPITSSNGPAAPNRYGLFHFYQPKTSLLRTWDTVEDVMLPSSRLPLSRTPVSSTSDVVSLDHIKSLDPTLAPYPYDRLSEWKALTSHIDATTIARAIGFKPSGDSLVDGFSMTVAEAPKPIKQQWGKLRPAEDDVSEEAQPVDTLNFASFDLKRSWPPEAIGEELTKHSRDKSWLRQQVFEQVQGPDQLLGELQLSFILFIQLTNFSALDVYKDILSLLCRSSVSPNDVDVYEQLLRILYSQLASLRTEFFVEDLPALESFYLDSLDSLRRSLKMVATAQSVIVEEWNRLAQMARDRYGWGLRQVSGYAKVQSGTTHYDLLPREGVGQQSDDEDLLAEEGEDAPVVVDL